MIQKCKVFVVQYPDGSCIVCNDSDIAFEVCAIQGLSEPSIISTYYYHIEGGNRLGNVLALGKERKK